ncbi:MAG: hypothetical protein ABJJ44_01895 [Paraglaciecola sp.]|uniref:hypothetical protein n=1 Tax=Paraglaciecola sp. TaxID=1920173 RepID=UPI003299F761
MLVTTVTKPAINSQNVITTKYAVADCGNAPNASILKCVLPIDSATPVQKTGIFAQKSKGKSKKPIFVIASIGGRLNIKDKTKKRLIEKALKFIHYSNALITYDAILSCAAVVMLFLCNNERSECTKTPHLE